MSNGVKNVTIKNGTIQNVAQGITIGSSTQNIVIEDMIFDTAIAGGTMYGIQATGPVQGLTMNDISFYNAAPQNIVLIGSTGNLITNVSADTVRCVSTNQSLSATPGTQATIHLIFCENVKMRDVIITNPYLSLDCILLNTCDGVLLDTVDVSSDLALSTATGVNLFNCANIEHENVEVFGSALTNGFSATTSSITVNLSYSNCSASNIAGTGFILSNGLNVKYSECTSFGCTSGPGFSVQASGQVFLENCTTSTNVGIGCSCSQITDLSIDAHSAFSNNSHGISCSSCENVVIRDSFVATNSSNGINVDDALTMGSNNIVIEGCVALENEGIGVSVVASNNVAIIDSSLQLNTQQGVKCDTVLNLSIRGCDAQQNTLDGFSIRGINGGTTPLDPFVLDPQLTTGRSPMLVEDCSAQFNSSNGFYFSNIGGASVRDCFASYNTNYGYWFDTGCWNVHITDCIATSNNNVGFITWDTPEVGYSSAANRFHHCFATQNNTNDAVNTLGTGDYSVDNTPLTPMISAIGAPVSTNTTMVIGLQDIVPVDWSSYN